ncbi:ACDE family multidrug resistance protein [Alkalibacillus filiformis]|uniref:ACDE family multidrug resistance protein n=1 Tax=Alkalibacillus filiformis TaxID=200990 RepID=A0ABU0DVK2_9BACI|nr:MFS transporter [Alkalibacillus filiformis]MDQ0352488.1 ACDE family multidrug resistance protein [Alkalibacillus filiformis]
MESKVTKTNDISIWCIITIASIPLIMTLGNSMLIPVLPVFEEEVGISPFQSSLIITVYSVAAILIIPIAGYLSDRYGRKMIMIPGLIFTFIGGLIAGIASLVVDNPFVWILVGRVFQGIGAAGALPIILPLVGDLYKNDDEKASSCLGLVETSNTFGKVLSPIIGAFFAAMLWYLPFFSISAFSLISLIAVIFFIKVPKDKEEPLKFKEFLTETKKIFQVEGKWLYTVFLLGAYTMLLLFGILFYLSDILEKQYGVDGVPKGVVLAYPLVVLCLTSFITGRKIKGDLKTMKVIIMSAVALLAVSITTVGFSTDSVTLLLISTSLNGLAIGALLPTLDAMITESINKETRGTITSFYSSARFIGVAAGPPIVSLLMPIDINVGYIMAGVLGALLFILSWKWINPDQT